MQIEKITKPAQIIVSMSTQISHEHIPNYIGTAFVAVSYTHLTLPTIA